MSVSAPNRVLLSFILGVSVFILLMGSHSPAAQAAVMETDSKVIAATVYQNRASVTRQAVIDVPKGAHQIVLSGIPMGMDPNSIRVKGASSSSNKAMVVIGTVKHDLKNTPRLSNEREAALNAQMRTLQDQVAVLNAEKMALNARQSFLQNIGKQAELRSDEAVAELQLNSAEWLSASETIQAGMRDVLTQKLQLDFKIRDFDEQIKAIQNDMNQLRGGQKRHYNVTIAVEAEADAKLTLEVTYQINEATWVPVYDARLDNNADGSSMLDLVQYGTVSQRTGEDWSNVSLSLSTAQPHRSATLAELSPNWVNVYPEGSRLSAAKMSMSRSSGIGVQSLEKEHNFAQADMAEAPMEVAYVPAQVQKKGFAVEYKIAGQVDVASDGSESKLRIGTATFNHEMQTHLRPQIAPNAYLMAKLTLQGDAPLLAGQVSLYRDEAFIGKAYMPFLMPNKVHYLSFGINDNVVVKTKTLKEEAKKAGMILSENTFERHMVTEVENISTDQDYTLVVQQRIPSSRNEELSVSILDDATTKGYEQDWNNVKGALYWEQTLAAQSKSEFKLGYEMSWPKGYRVSGEY